MAEDMRSWLAQAIIAYDREHGTNRSSPCKGGLVQLISWSSFRTPYDPNVEIRGVAADRTHWVKVRFDADATDKFEEPQASLPSESLTSHLRSIFRLTSFDITLEAPPPSSRRKPGSYPASPYGELPQVVLLVKEWEVVSGNRDDPRFYPDLQELGRGAADTDVHLHRVLRKWWLGESNSDQSENLSSQLETPSRYTSNPKALVSSPLVHTPYHQPSSSASGGHPESKPTDHQPAGFETLTDFLRPYLHPNGGKKRVIPEWLFEMPDETKQQLEDITLFGMNLGVLEKDSKEDLADGSSSREIEGRRGRIPSEAMSEKGKGKQRAVDQTAGDDVPMLQLQEEVAADEPRKPVTATRVQNPYISSSSPGRSTQSTQSVQPVRPMAPVQPNQLTQASSPTQPSQPVASLRQTPRKSLNEDDSEDEIQIKAPATKKRRKDMFDPLAFSSPPGISQDREMAEGEEAAEEVEEEEEVVQSRHAGTKSGTKGQSITRNVRDKNGGTDEEDLSDYERGQRRQAKSAARRTPLSPIKRTLGGSSCSPKEEKVLVSIAIQTESLESLSQSHTSKEFSLSTHIVSASKPKTTTPSDNPIAASSTSQARHDPEAMDVDVMTEIDEQDAREADELVPESHSLSKLSTRRSMSAVLQTSEAIPFPDPAAPVERQAYILVDDSDQSLPQPSQEQSSGSQRRAIPPSAPINPSEGNGVGTASSRQKHANDSSDPVKPEPITPSVPRSQITNSSGTGTGKSSRKSFLQSIRFVRPSSVDVKVEAQTDDSPSLNKGRKEGRTDARREGLLERIGYWVGSPGYEESEEESIEGEKREEATVEEERAEAAQRAPVTEEAEHAVEKGRVEGKGRTEGADEAEHAEEGEAGEPLKGENSAREGVRPQNHYNEHEEEREEVELQERLKETVSDVERLSSPKPIDLPAPPRQQTSPVHPSHRSPSVHIKGEDQSDRRSVSPVRRARKLGGYTLDLKFDGLSERFVKDALEKARAQRARSRVK